jgi:hypothetical protein
MKSNRQRGTWGLVASTAIIPSYLLAPNDVLQSTGNLS